MPSCKNCAQTLPDGAKFCSNCGTKVPSSAQISVEQDIGTVSGSGTVTGTVLGDTDSLPGSSSSVKQKVDTVTGGGAVIGTVVGGESATHIGGTQQYGDTVEGDKHVHEETVGGDKITVGDISGSSGIAIGTGAQAQVNQNYDLLPPAGEKGISDMLQPNPDVFVPPGDSGLEKSISSDMSAESVLEAIIGTNEIVDHGITAGLIERGLSVARIRMLGHKSLASTPPAELATVWQNLAQNGQLSNFVGTGWILGSARSVIITNHHVLPLQAAAATARLEFGYQRDILRNTTTTGPIMRLHPDKLFFTSPTMSFGGLDYSVVALQEQASPELGFLDFIPGNTTEFTALVYVVQHPGGAPKAYVVNHNRKINLSDKYLTYTSDTKGGSSGSPLFDDDLNLIGIHHIGNHKVEVNGQSLFTNLGSRMEVVIDDLARQMRKANWDEARVEEWFGAGSVLNSFK